MRWVNLFFVLYSGLFVLDFFWLADVQHGIIRMLTCYEERLSGNGARERISTKQCILMTDNFHVPCEFDVMSSQLDENPVGDPLTLVQSPFLKLPLEVSYYGKLLPVYRTPYVFGAVLPLIFFLFCLISALIYQFKKEIIPGIVAAEILLFMVLSILMLMAKFV